MIQHLDGIIPERAAVRVGDQSGAATAKMYFVKNPMIDRIVRTGKYANRLIAGNESSAINRAVAFYRYLVGVPTALEPPAAR